MEKLSQAFEENLQEYLDGTLTLAQREAFEHSLKENSLLMKRFDELKTADLALSHLSPEQPSENFTSSVIGRLNQYQLGTGISVRNGILLLSGVLIITTLTVILLSTGVFDHRITFDLNGIAVQKYMKQSLPTIPVNGELIVNGIVILNLVLAFLILDRAILKPLFRRRTEAGGY